MKRTIAPETLHRSSPFFLDYIGGKPEAIACFQHSPDSLPQLAALRREAYDGSLRSEVCDALQNYNCILGADSAALRGIDELRRPEALCVIGGQQAGFLGGPAFVLYKIASILRAARWIREQLDTPVIPIFWLASEDHDFEEINHLRWIEDSGALRATSFQWEDAGRAIEQLPITDDILSAYTSLKDGVPVAEARFAEPFSPEPGDDYARWHARQWSRLFSPEGLVLVEPRTLRPLASPFFEHTLGQLPAIRSALAERATLLKAHNYPVPLDIEHAGVPFQITASEPRRRIAGLPDPTAALSADAALRPVLADSLLPTAATIVGSSELGYHALLAPLYTLFGIPQPIVFLRHGATVLSSAERTLLDVLDLGVVDILHPEFKAADVAAQRASTVLRGTFDKARATTEEALLPVRAYLESLDPSLPSRWRQTIDQVKHQIGRLEERAIRAELAKSGVSVKRLQALRPRLLPMETLQERVLSAFSLIAAYGVEWVIELAHCGTPGRFEHRILIPGDSHEQR